MNTITARLIRAWEAFKADPEHLPHTLNNQSKVFVDQSREWLDIQLAPRGVKLHLLTVTGVATHGALSDRTLFQFKGWEPLPNTPHWMKEI